MQGPEVKPALVAFLLFLAAADVQAEGPSPDVAVEFSVPAQMQGDLQASTEWVLLLIPPEATAAVSVLGAVDGSTTNRTYLAEHSDSPLHGSKDSNFTIDERTADAAVSDLRLSFGGGWGLLFIEGQDLLLTAGPSAMEVLRSDGERSPSMMLPTVHKPWRSDRWDREPASPGPGLNLKGLQPGQLFPFKVKSQAATTIEWHNATTACSSAQCLDGAQTTGQAYRPPLDEMFVGLFNVPFVELAGNAPMNVEAQGLAYVAAAGGSQIDVLLDGSGRFPQADFLSECSPPSCDDPAGRTLKLEGRVELEDLRHAPSGAKRLQANAAGAFTEARFDEEQIPALMVGGAAAGAAVVGVGLVVLVKALFGLFARNTRPILEHPRAKAIHDLVHGTPGLAFSDVRDTLRFGHGTTQYHLRRLLGAGFIVAYEDGHFVRYYENHGRHAKDWQTYAALHKPMLRQLHEWIAEHPRSNQIQVIAAAAKWGWKRSTTQHRLRALVAANLIRDHRMPGAVEYVAMPLNGQR